MDQFAWLLLGMAIGLALGTAAAYFWGAWVTYLVMA